MIVGTAYMVQRGLGDDARLAALRDAGKRYGWRARWVLRGVNVTLDRGCVVEVRGANGAGKSTLLRMLAGATLPTRGRRLAGPGLAVGYAPERLDPAPPFAAGAYLAHRARVRRLPRRKGLADALALAERLGLTPPLLREPLGSLSKGSLQKVVLTQALLGRPQLVVMDEPFAGLDSDTSDGLADLLAELAEAGTTVVFSDHRESRARPRADVRWRVHDASVAEVALEEQPSDLYRLPGVTEVARTGRQVRLLVRGQDSDRAWSRCSTRAGTSSQLLARQMGPRCGSPLRFGASRDDRSRPIPAR